MTSGCEVPAGTFRTADQSRADTDPPAGKPTALLSSPIALKLLCCCCCSGSDLCHLRSDQPLCPSDTHTHTRSILHPVIPACGHARHSGGPGSNLAPGFILRPARAERSRAEQSRASRTSEQLGTRLAQVISSVSA